MLKFLKHLVKATDIRPNDPINLDRMQQVKEMTWFATANNLLDEFHDAPMIPDEEFRVQIKEMTIQEYNEKSWKEVQEEEYADDVSLLEGKGVIKHVDYKKTIAQFSEGLKPEDNV